MLLQGLFVPLTCPFYRDGASYLRKLEHNVRRYSLGPAAGLVALPPDGEAAALTDAEAAETLRVVGETAGKEKVLIAGVERGSVHAALLLAQTATDAGFDAILLAPPTDWARLVQADDVRALLLFYQTVADRSPLPVVLWSDARPPALPLPVAAVGDLAQHPNVLGLLDAQLTPERLGGVLAATAAVQREVTVTTVFEAVTRRMLAPVAPVGGTGQAFVAIENLSAGTAATSSAVLTPVVPTLKTRSKAVGFQVLSAGMASELPPLLQRGTAGTMPAVAACAPQGCFEVYAAWKDGDEALAAERAARLGPTEAVLHELGAAGVKYGCDWNGFFGGHPRLPRLPLTAAERERVEKTLGEVRN